MTELTKEQEELNILKKRAESLGINFGAQIGAETLRERIAAKLEEDAEKQNLEEPKEPVKKTPRELRAERKINEAEPETKNQRKARLRREASKLVRVKVVCYDPKKRNHKGDFFSVSNSAIGSFRRFIPYNNQAGWHVEQVFVDLLREKEFQSFEHDTDSRGNDIKRAVLSPAYSVEILPNLSVKELKDLQQRQAMAKA